MSKAREFWIIDKPIGDDVTLVKNTYLGSSEKPTSKTLYQWSDKIIHVREVLPDEVSDSIMLEWLAKNERVLRKVGANEYRIAHTEAELKFNTPREAILAAMQKKGK